MGRAPCCDKVGLKRGPWTAEEDQILVSFIDKHGHSNWRALPKQAGLLRCGKSCRLRWINYLKPDIKRGNFTKEEEESIIQLHEMMGNRWSAIAAKLPGRTDNEIKNVWHTHLKKRLEKYQSATKPQAKKARNTTKCNNGENKTIISNSTCTSDGTSDYVSASPGQSYTTSEDNSSSVTDISSVEFAYNMANNKEAKDEQMLKTQHSDDFDDYIPIIDDTFWSIQDFSEDSTMPQISYNFSTTNIENSQDNYNYNYYDENMDFWMDVFVRAGEKSEMPEFVI